MFARALPPVALLAVTVMLAFGGPVAAQGTPLLDDPLNCAREQASFGGPQPVDADDTVTVNLSTQCFLVLGLDIAGGEQVGITYLSGEFGSLNVAFYLRSAAPGASFHDPANARLGLPSARSAVPGQGTVPILVAIQAVGGPNLGTAALRIDTGTAPPPTTTTSTSTTSTTAPTATTAVEESVSSTGSTSISSTTSEPAGTPSSALLGDEDGDGTPESPTTDAGPTGVAQHVAGVLPVWWLLVAAAIAIAAITLLFRQRRAARSRGTLTPLDRPVITWTMQHAPPTGTCASSTQVLVDADDDGSLEGWNVSGLFALEERGRRSRSVVEDPLLAQIETLWAGRGSGGELRSAVDAFVNTLTRHLDGRRIGADSVLLLEMRRDNVSPHGTAWACTDGSWVRYDRWQEIPDIADPAQHDLVQVVVLASPGEHSTGWELRSDELAAALTDLIETRRAPAGLWVFD